MVYRETISVATDATNSARTLAHLKALGADDLSFRRVIIYAREHCSRQVDAQKAVRLIASMAMANRCMVVYFQRSI